LISRRECNDSLGKARSNGSELLRDRCQRRTLFTMLAAIKLARLAGPARCISTSSPRRSDALFVVRPLAPSLTVSFLTHIVNVAA